MQHKSRIILTTDLFAVVIVRTTATLYTLTYARCNTSEAYRASIHFYSQKLIGVQKTVN